jgi:hypothetical protein
VDEWLDRLEEETSVWSITRGYARARMVPSPAAARGLWQEVAGPTEPACGALARVVRDELRGVQGLPGRLPRGLR